MSDIYQAPGVLSWGTQGRSAKSGLGDVTAVKARAEMQRAVGYQDLKTRNKSQPFNSSIREAWKRDLGLDS